MSKHDTLCLTKCNFKQCEAMCCYDGVYLKGWEVLPLQRLIEANPKLRSALPQTYFDYGTDAHGITYVKTSTREHTYSNPEYPKHFAQTRCVFADVNGLCELEKFAFRLNVHKWTFKPSACWLFPLTQKEHTFIPPPLCEQDDPYHSEHYPGYVTHTPCGKHSDSGIPWQELLQEEVQYFQDTVGKFYED